MFERMKSQTTWRRKTAQQPGSSYTVELSPQTLSQLVVEQVSDAVFILDQDGNITDANPAACRMLGYDRDELLVLHGFDLSCDRNLAQRVIDRQVIQQEEGGNAQPERIRLKRKDGSTVHVESVNHPLFDSHGELVGYAAFNRDVTQEEEQSNEIELLSSIVEQSDTAVAVVKVEGDGDGARVVYINPALEKLFGGSPRSLIGHKVPLLSGRTALDEESRKAYQESREKGVAGRAYSLLNRPDGTQRIIDVRFSPIRNGSGEITHWVGLNTDVTEQFEKDQRLRVIERSLENLDVGYTITRNDNSTGIVEYANPAWERITGYDRDEIIGKQLPPLIVDDPQNTLDRDAIVKAFFERQPVSGLSRAIRRDGSTFMRELEVGPVADASGKPTHWYSITKDMTEQVAQSEQLRLLSSTVDQSPAATIIATVNGPDTTVAYVNKAWEKLFEISAKDALNRPWTETQIATPVDDASRDAFIAATNTGTSGVGDMTFVDSSGIERFIHVVLNPIKNDEDAITHWVGTCTDVTEQRAKDARLRVIEKSLETMDVGYMTTVESSSGPKVDYINPALERMLGVSAQQLLGQPPPDPMRTHENDSLIPRDLELSSTHLHEADQSGDTATGLVKTKRADGSTFYRRVHIGPVKDEDGQSTHWYSLSTDITQDLERNQQLHIFKLVFEQSPNPIVVVDDHEQTAKVVFANTAYCTLLGIDPTRVSDSTLTQGLLENETNSENVQRAKEARRAGQSVDLSFQYAGPKGNVIHLETRMFPISEQGGSTTLWASISVDVSAEVEAKARLQLLEQAWEQSPTGMTITSAGDMTIQETNPAFESMSQFKNSELIGMNTSSYWEKTLSEQGETKDALQMLRHTGSFNGVIATRRKDGSEYQRDVHCNPIRDKSGNITHILSMSTDITRRLAREERMRLLDSALDQSAAAVVIVEAEQMTFTYINTAFENQTGYSASELIGTSSQEFWSSAIVEKVSLPNLQDVLKNETAYEGRMICKRKDGSTYHRSVNSAPVKDDSGKVTHWISVSNDISDMVEREQSLHNLKRAIENLDVGFVITQEEGSLIEYANPAFATITGTNRKEVVGHTYPIPYVDDPENTFDVDYLIACKQQSKPIEGIARSKRPDGSTFMRQVKAAPITNDAGDVTHWYSLISDVTEKLDAERHTRLLERALDQSPAAKSIASAENLAITYVNPAFEKLTGYMSDEVLGRNIQQFWLDHTISAPDTYQPDEIVASGKAFSERALCCRKDGSTFHRDFVVTPILDARGKISHWLSSSDDVSDNVAAEQQLILFNQALDQSASSVAIVDAPTMTFQYVNAAFETMTGFAAADVIGQKSQQFWAHQVVDPDDLERLDTGLSGDVPFSERVLSVRKDRTVYHRDLVCAPIRNEKGVMTHWISVSDDVTEAVEAEQQLLLMNRALEQSPTGVCIAEGDDLEVTYANQAYCEIAGVSLEDLVGATLREFWDARTIERPDKEGFRTAHTEGRAFTDVSRCRRSDGTEYYREASAAPVRDVHGNITHWVGVSSDITEIMERQEEIETLNSELESRVEKRTEQLRSANDNLWQTLKNLKETQNKLVESEKLASLGNLVAGVAHEINTPIGIAVTAASMISEQLQTLQTNYSQGALSVEQLERFFEQQLEADSILAGNLKRASELISSFKQVAVDQSSGDQREIDLGPYLREILKSLEPQLKKKKVYSQVSCADGVMLETSPGALAQVVTNLALNSVTHAYDGAEDQKIELSVIEQGAKLRLIYRDFGAGMGEDQLARIFEPFFTTRRGHGGSGLGMHIVYNLVNQTLGGTISVESSLGIGSSFEIVLPKQSSKVSSTQDKYEDTPLEA